ncbi:ABC transporter substrate-binding protein [Rhodospirillum rubrum]|uniref:metal ABC transporter substrate-binding protein n=1 Tax=Rhodospirillum rubrum TaxID=1085 RepID=UPI0019049070|nr:metal ABC transporter substrate-binding protein [Rhodospirillum rubrum]MBK1663806.1 ABC transporter substrate-binding protein [Rhodospirillum rubrum]MBK1675855.1 ABC transporter substrate-binding protein [Rhodospirillum rubrum]
MNRRRFLSLAAATAGTAALPARSVFAADRPRIGVTLHPYYSYVAHIVGEAAEVVPIIPAGFNPHAYEPRPEDIRRIGTLDVLVVNGIGHDDFAGRMVAASERPDLPLIEANAEVPLLAASGANARTGASGKVVNPHTFLSITGSIQQVYTIARALGERVPDRAELFTTNARAYAKRLRGLRAAALAKLAGAPEVGLRVATIHDAYNYLLREFGLEVAAVVEPAHGIEPSPAQLAETIDTLRRLDVQVIFSELNFPSPYVETIRRETGIALYAFSHISTGAYTASLFEEETGRNLDTLVRAMLEAKG